MNAESAQRKWIDDARKLLGARKVKLHDVPTWLKKRLRAYRKRKHLLPLPASLLLENTDTGGVHGWLDHFGTVDHPRLGKVFVSEPYGLTDDGALSLAAYCKVLGLEWYVDANSWWYPGHTVRIVIYEHEK